ncbi:MAG TPA: 2-dehydropantoate 2-reductase, partial [Solirubrobacteraceae bacterium]|nr:2-dehydropantoate 2-reductase [Solirubrobacteraceae bacterium]
AMGTIAILGPGGVGGFLAAALARAGEPVIVVARPETAEHVVRHGLAVQSARLGEFRARPRTASELTEETDVLIVATKARGLAAGLERIQANPKLVVPLLNGLDHMEALRARFAPEHVAAGAIRIESDRPEPGRIVQTSPFLRIDLATRWPELRPALEWLAQRLERAEIPARVCESEAQVLWSKLVRLNALALTTSAADRPVGFIRSDPDWRADLRACIEEAAAVARADGADIDPSARLAELDDAHPGLGSSMQRDIAAGQEPELDAIAGSILRAARRHGVPCPTISRLSLQVAERAGVAPPAAAA